MRKILIMLSMVMTGCSTVRYNHVKTDRTDSVAVVHTRADSIAVRDSIMIDRTTDTVRIARWHTETHWRMQHDTVWHTRTDTIQVSIPEPKRDNTSATALWYSAGNLAIGILAGMIAALLLYLRFSH
ncbi:MAG: hypothetical protein K2M65_06575 [Muribaculaceae bacterium]|nr:hypothetical protein [Muribaculaceae bacterium]